MTKKEIVRAVHSVHGGISYAEAQAIVEGIFEIVKARLGRGEKVTLTRFGVFQVNRRKERQIRHLKTGEMIRIRPLNYLTFRASRLNQVIEHEQPRAEEAVLQNRRSMQAGGR